MLEEITEGMNRTPKRLPSKYFYDARGSALFDQITDLDEYYLTRTEKNLLEVYIQDIQGYLGDDVILIEPGSGSSEKTRVFFEPGSSVHTYIPIDISARYLSVVADGLREDYPHLTVIPQAADYTRPFELPEIPRSGRKILFFPGSTIGNFKPEKIERFLTVMADILDGHGGFLIGVDLKKDIEVLMAAYNDSKGITAAFNKNILLHINDTLGSDFKPEAMSHRAVWNEERGRMEMRLYAKYDHTVRLNGNEFVLQEGEYLHTENSHKYTLDEFSEMVSRWFTVEKVWTDPEDYFSLQYLEPK